jgi:hypothetical protein
VSSAAPEEADASSRVELSHEDITSEQLAPQLEPVEDVSPVEPASPPRARRRNQSPKTSRKTARPTKESEPVTVETAPPKPSENERQLTMGAAWLFIAWPIVAALGCLVFGWSIWLALGGVVVWFTFAAVAVPKGPAMFAGGVVLMVLVAWPWGSGKEAALAAASPPATPLQATVTPSPTASLMPRATPAPTPSATPLATATATATPVPADPSPAHSRAPVTPEPTATSTAPPTPRLTPVPSTATLDHLPGLTEGEVFSAFAAYDLDCSDTLGYLCDFTTSAGDWGTLEIDFERDKQIRFVIVDVTSPTGIDTAAALEAVDRAARLPYTGAKPAAASKWLYTNYSQSIRIAETDFGPAHYVLRVRGDSIVSLEVGIPY